MVGKGGVEGKLKYSWEKLAFVKPFVIQKRNPAFFNVKHFQQTGEILTMVMINLLIS